MESRVEISDKIIGMELAKPIMNERGVVILASDCILKANHIKKLRNIGFTSLYIKIAEDSKGDLGYAEPQLPDNFSKSYNDTVNQVKEVFSSLRYMKEVPVLKMRVLADENINQLINTCGVINYLCVIKQSDEYTFDHSLKVAVLAGMIGKWLGYSQKKVKELIITGLLHDIGKMKIDKSIIDKPHSLTEDELIEVRHHSAHGYKLLDGKDNISMDIRLGILQHHERIDGTGYPLKVNGEKIHNYAKIIAVADMYAAITSDRPYKQKATPFTALEIIAQEQYNKLDTKISMVAIENIKKFLIGSQVILNNDERAEVIQFRTAETIRPIVKTEYLKFIDLDINRELEIMTYLPI